MSPDLDALRAEIAALARAELRLEGPLPAGDLSEALDSMQRLSLVVAIEDRYRICFDPADEAGARTLDDVARLVFARLSESDAALAGAADGP